jgi:hypothetical protein
MTAMKNKPANASIPMADARLDAVLRRLPVAPVPSNFTTRVLAAVELEEIRLARASRHWSWRWLFPRLAVSTAILLVAGISIQRHEIHSQRMELAKNIAAVAVSQPTPSVDALENLEVIQRMNQAGRADGELLAALQ